MRIDYLHLDGFGVLADVDFEFQPGLNVVIGPNEVGKSTLQQAILAMLYGFYSGGRVNATEKKLHARYRPWNSSHYSGSILLRSDSNKAFMVMRNFSAAEPETQIIDEQSKQNITTEFSRGRRGHVAFIEQMSGLSFAVFQAVACVNQGQLTRISKSQAEDIAEAVLRLVDSASAEVSARTALNKIATAIRALGTERSKSGPIHRARADLAVQQRLRDEQKAIKLGLQQDQERLDELAIKTAELLDDQKQLEHDIHVSEYLQLQNLLRRFDAVKNKQQELQHDAALIKPKKEIHLQNRDTVVRLHQERKDLNKRRLLLNTDLRNLHDELSQANTDIEKLPVEKNFWRKENLSEFYELDAAYKRISNKAAELERQRSDIHSKLQAVGLSEKSIRLAQLSDNDIEHIQVQADELEAQKAELEAERGKREDKRSFFRLIRSGMLFFSAVLAVILLAVMYVPDLQSITTLYPFTWAALRYSFTLLIVGLILGQVSFHMQYNVILENIEADKRNVELKLRHYQESLLPYGVSSIKELIEQRMRYLDMQRLNDYSDSHLNEKNELEEALSKWLQKLDMHEFNPENLQRAVVIFRRGSQLRKYIDETSEKIENRDRELEGLDTHLHAIEKEMHEIYSGAGTDTENLESAYSQFLEQVNAAYKYIKFMGELKQMQEIEREMLAGRDITQLRTQFDELKKEVKEADLIEPLIPVKELKRSLKNVHNQLHDIALENVRLQERIREREAKIPDLSEIEENIVTLKAKLRELTYKRRALELAHETITEVAQQAHQNFAPRLSNSVGRYLSSLSDSEYKQIYIDPADFTMQVAHDKAKKLVPIDFLSYGTQEQIYLLLRAAVAELFSEQNENIPLFLDDPLAHADDKRQIGALELLLHLAENQQIFYFTKDADIVKKLETLSAPFHLVKMPLAPEMVPYRWAAGTAFKEKPGNDT